MGSTEFHLPHLAQELPFSTPQERDIIGDLAPPMRGISAQHITTIDAGNYMSHPLEVYKTPDNPNSILITVIF